MSGANRDKAYIVLDLDYCGKKEKLIGEFLRKLKDICFMEYIWFKDFEKLLLDNGGKNGRK